MNYTKAQKEIFDALCAGKRVSQFEIDANNIFVTADGYKGYIIPKNLICFSLEKVAEMKPIPIKEIIQDQYQLTLTPDLRIIDARRTARRLKGNGKNVLVNAKFLSCFQNPYFYQAENMNTGVAVTEPVCRSSGQMLNLIARVSLQSTPVISIRQCMGNTVVAPMATAGIVAVSSGCRRWSEMTKQEAAAMLVQLYADYSTLCDKYGWPPSDGMSEAVAIAVQSLQEVE